MIEKDVVDVSSLFLILNDIEQYVFVDAIQKGY